MYTKETLKRISVESMECLNKDACIEERRKIDTFCTPQVRDNQITTSAKLLDITYESYGFSGNLIETINI